MRSIDAERALIGAVIADPARLLECSDVSRMHFHSEDLGDVWALLTTMTGRIDLVTLTEAAVSAGIPVALVLACKCPAAAAAGSYASIVMESWRRREVAREVEKFTEKIGGVHPVGHLVWDLTRKLDAIVGQGGSGASGYASIAEEHDSDLLDAMDGKVVGYSWGIDCLDRVSTLRKGKMYVIQARPAMGKSAVAQQVAEHLTTQGCRVLYVSTEMPKEELLTRSISMRTGIDSRAIEHGRITMAELEAIRAARAEACEISMLILDESGITVDRVKAESARYNADVVVVDYVQRLSGPGSEYERITRISVELADIKAGAGAPMLIALVQANRKCEERADKMPLPSDAKGSGQIEQDANFFASLLRPHHYDPEADPHLMEIGIMKNRGGPCGRIEAHWDAPTTTLSDHGRDVVALD